MEKDTLLSRAGILNMIAGYLTAAFWYIHPDPRLTDMAARMTFQWKISYGIFLISLLFTLFGLIGIVIKQLEKEKSLGLAGFAAAFIGTAILIGAGTFEGFVSPVLVLKPATAALLDPNGPLMMSLAPIFLVGGMSFAVGYILIGISVLKAKLLPAIPGMLVIASAPILGLSAFMPEAARTAGCVVFGFSNVWLGYALWQEERKTSQKKE